MSGVQKITMAVTMLDGTSYSVRVMPGDVVRTERQYGVSATQIDADPHLEHILYMAWLASKRQAYGGSFDDFMEAVEDVDAQSGGPANPTLPAP